MSNKQQQFVFNNNTNRVHRALCIIRIQMSDCCRYYRLDIHRHTDMHMKNTTLQWFATCRGILSAAALCVYE